MTEYDRTMSIEDLLAHCRRGGNPDLMRSALAEIAVIAHSTTGTEGSALDEIRRISHPYLRSSKSH